MAIITREFRDGEDFFFCTSCEDEVEEHLIENYLDGKSKFCPNCGEEVTDLDI